MRGFLLSSYTLCIHTRPRTKCHAYAPVTCRRIIIIMKCIHARRENARRVTRFISFPPLARARHYVGSTERFVRHFNRYVQEEKKKTITVTSLRTSSETFVLAGRKNMSVYRFYVYLHRTLGVLKSSVARL